MPQTTGTFATDQASKYLQQLCKHFAHKIEVTYTPTQGTCHFVFGPAEMRATDTELQVQIDLQDESAVAQAQSVIDKHLARFAFREGFTNMTWQV